MTHPVFISYARSTSRPYAEVLQRELGAEVAFLDSSDIEAGEHFPKRLVDALLRAKVVVVFADEAYFRRWYCLWELRTALTPFLSLGPEAGETERREALAPIVLALPPQGGSLKELGRLPPWVSKRHWPRADEPEALRDLVLERVAAARWTLGGWLAERAHGEARARTLLLEDAALPPPVRLNAQSVKRLYPLEQLPSLGEFFVGRANELWRLDFLLSTRGGSEEDGAAPIVTVEAIGGSGKTRLALEYIHRLGPHRFPGGIFWVDADVSEARLEEQLHGILRVLRPHQVPELAVFRQQKRDAARELAEALHEATQRESMLYVVDNVPEPGPGRGARPLKAWCPAVGKVALLATSRASIALGEAGAQTLSLGVLSSDTAVALLTAGVDEPLADGSGWQRIAEWVGQLPLALELLNRALRAGLGPDELLAMARRQGPARQLDAQLEALRGQLPEGVLRGVTEAFDVSYERLAEPVRRTARLVARLAPAPIPMELMKALGPEVFSHTVRVALRSRHFVTHVVRGPVPFLGVMHRVLADFLCSKSDSPEEELHRLSEALMAVTGKHMGTQEWPLLDACVPHAEKISEEFLGSRPASPSQAESGIVFGLGVGRLLSTRGLQSRAANLERRVLERARSVLGEDHLGTFAAMHNLAVTLRAQGALAEARELETRVLEVLPSVIGEEHATTLEVMESLALTIQEQSGLADARTLLEQVVNGLVRVRGKEHPDTLRAKGHFATTLQLLGEPRRARELEEQILDDWRRQVGDEHPHTLTAMNNLATTLQALGKLEAARELQEQVLKARKQFLGPDHPDTLTAMNNLAITLGMQGNLPGARELQHEMVEARRRVLGEEHPDTLSGMSTLASILFRLGNWEEACGLEEGVLKVRDRILGKEHPDTLLSVRNLANSYLLHGNLERAHELWVRLVDVWRRVLGEQHPATLTAMINVATTRFRMTGDRAEARERMLRVVGARLKTLGPDHQDTRQALSILSWILSSPDRPPSANVQDGSTHTD